MKLAGQDDVWQKMQETKAVPKAWKWFQNAMKDLVGFVKEIPALFVKAFKSLEILDVILLPKAFAKVMGVLRRGGGPDVAGGHRDHWASERPRRQYPMNATRRRSTPSSPRRPRSGPTWRATGSSRTSSSSSRTS